MRRISEYDVLLHKKDEELAVLRTSVDLVNKPSTHEKLTQTNDLEVFTSFRFSDLGLRRN